MSADFDRIVQRAQLRKERLTTTGVFNRYEDIWSYTPWLRLSASQTNNTSALGSSSSSKPRPSEAWSNGHLTPSKRQKTATLRNRLHDTEAAQVRSAQSQAPTRKVNNSYVGPVGYKATALSSGFPDRAVAFGRLRTPHQECKLRNYERDGEATTNRIAMRGKPPPGPLR